MTISRTALVTVTAVVGVAIALISAVNANAERPEPGLLRQLESGRWELRQREASTVKSICIGADRRRLIQVRHPDLACETVVLEDSLNTLTVQYTCRGHGYGRTRIRRESGQLIQIETQGIAEGLPFEISAEGRRTGDCQP